MWNHVGITRWTRRDTIFRYSHPNFHALCRIHIEGHVQLGDWPLMRIQGGGSHVRSYCLNSLLRENS